MEGVIRINFIQNSMCSQSKPYIVASWQNVLMRLLDLSDVTGQCGRLLTQPIFYFFHGIVRWLPSTTANNPENAETGCQRGSDEGWIAICSAIGQEQTTEGCDDTCNSVPQHAHQDDTRYEAGSVESGVVRTE